MRQGHLRLIRQRKTHQEEIKKLKEQKRTSGKIILLCRKRQTLCKRQPREKANIKNGSEIIAINNLETEKLFKKYEPLITSDGYNTTYQKIFDGEKISFFFSLLNME